MKKLRLSVNFKVISGILAIMISVMVVGWSVFDVTNKKSMVDEKSLYTYQLISELKEARVNLAEVVRYEHNYLMTEEESNRQQYKEGVVELRDVLGEVAELVGEKEGKEKVEEVMGLMEAFPGELAEKMEPEDEDEVEEDDEEMMGVESGFSVQAGVVDGLLKEMIAGGEEQLSINEMEANKKADELIWWIIFGTILCSSMALLTALIVAFSVTRPLVKLKGVIESISKGDLATKMDEKIINTNDEVGDLARAFDRTMVSLKLAMKKNKPNEKMDE